MLWFDEKSTSKEGTSTTYYREDEISPLLNSFITCQLQKCTNYSENFIEKSSSHANGKKRKYAYLTHSKGSLRLLVLVCPKTMQLATLSIESAKLAFFCSWMLMCGAIIIINSGSTHYIYIKKLGKNHCHMAILF